MKKKGRAYLCLVLLLLIASCDSGKESVYVVSDSVEAFDLVLVDTLRMEDLLGGWLRPIHNTGFSPMVVDSSGHVYLLESVNQSAYRISAFDAAGGLKWVLDQSGQAPGEILAVTGIAVGSDSLLYVANQLGSRIDVFTVDGVYKQSHYITDAGIDAPYVSIAGYTTQGELIVVSGFTGEVGLTIRVLEVKEDTLEVKNEFDVIQTGEFEMLEGYALAPSYSVIDDYVVLGSMSEYAYTWYSTDGKSVHVLKRAEVVFSPPALVVHPSWGIAHREYSLMQPLIDLGPYYLGSAEWPTKYISQNVSNRALTKNKVPDHDLYHTIDVFDSETNRLLVSVNPQDYGIRRILQADRNGYLYAQLIGAEEEIEPFNEALRIGRFQVVLREGN